MINKFNEVLDEPKHQHSDERQQLVLHFRPDYEDVEDHQFFHNQLVKEVGCRRVRVRTWKEFTSALSDECPDLITIHHNVINKNYELSEFVTYVQQLTENTARRCTCKVPVAIAIDSECTQEFVNKLKTSGAVGVFLVTHYYDVAQSAESLKQLLDNNSYWPEDIISQLPNPKNKPLIISYRETTDTWAEHEDVLLNENSQFRTEVLYNLTDEEIQNNLIKILTSLEKRPDIIHFHWPFFLKDSKTLDVYTSILEIAKTPIGVVIEPDCPQSLIKQLKKIPAIKGIVPSRENYSMQQRELADEELYKGNEYWPKHIISRLPSNKPNVLRSRGGITLTVRQQEVMDLICNRGLSNKQIAKSLKLSESTVKIHVSAIMRSYGVRNRTQLALSASQGLKA